MASENDMKKMFASPIVEFIFGKDTINVEENFPVESKKNSAAFAVVEEEELQSLKDKNKNSNTEKCTNTWINRFEKWQQTRGININLPDISPIELDSILQKFYAELRTEKGEEYEPASLRTMLGALHRYVKGKGYSTSIITSMEFAGSREVLNGKAISLREQGKGKMKRKADSISDEDEEAMWESGVLGHSSPKSLNQTIFFQISQHFGTRGCQEHHQINMEDLKIVSNPITGEVEYVEWVEGITKTRQGGLIKQQRRLPQRMFAVGGPKCPMVILQKIISKRPEELKARGPLYLTPLQCFDGKEVWFSKTKVGVNKINSFLKEMASNAGVTKSNKRYTNHSVRKTTVRKLQRAGFSNDKISSITGHKSEQSIRDYAETDNIEHKNMSHTLSASEKRKTASSSGPAINCPSIPVETQTPTHFFSHCSVNINYGAAHSSLTSSSLHLSAPPCKKMKTTEWDNE